MDLKFKPCGKACYPTRKEAKKELKLLNLKKNFNLQNIYYCEECCHWHTTSMTKEKYREKQKL